MEYSRHSDFNRKLGCLINGRGVHFTDPNGVAFAGVFTHEFGHAINLAHTQVNGAIGFYGDNIGLAGCSFLPYSGLPLLEDVETMYPFINTRLGTGGSGETQSTVNQLDDKVSVSNLYPAPGWRESTCSISGKILTTNGKSGVMGVKVIARNLNSLFADATSAMSGDYTRGSIGDDGSFTINGLTPGGRYVIYADAIRVGGFPTAQPEILPGPEEFYNGSNESGNGLKDNPCQSVTLTPVQGNTETANIEFNSVKNGPSLTVLADYPNALATDISGDGKTVVGSINANGAPSFRWTEKDGFNLIGGVGGVTKISPDGNHIAASSIAAARIWFMLRSGKAEQTGSLYRLIQIPDPAAVRF